MSLSSFHRRRHIALCNIKQYLVAADLMELELKVEGMTCDGCSSRVADALKV